MNWRGTTREIRVSLLMLRSRIVRVRANLKTFLGLGERYLFNFYTIKTLSSFLFVWPSQTLENIWSRSTWCSWYWQRHWHGIFCIVTHSMRAFSPSTIIAKLLSAFTSHRRASIWSLHPKIAVGTLLEFGSIDKLYKIFIILVKTIAYSILSAGHAIMKDTSAFQAIVFIASRTFIVVESLIKFEGCAASCSGTPSSWGVILLYELIEWEFLEFLLQISINELINVAHL